MNFDSSYPPPTLPANPEALRRPRSVTPSHPHRVPHAHARRPSTANEVPSSFGASHSGGYTSSWRHHSGQHAPRGYHPYAAPPHDHSYGTESSHSSPGGSPFAVSLSTPASEYPSESCLAGEYGSESSPQPQAQPQEYAATQQQPSPHLQAQFAHMVSLESVSPIENVEFVYPHDPEAYERTGSGSSTHGHPERVQPAPANYQYTSSGVEYASSSGSSNDSAMYHQMVPAHDAEMHQQYYEQQVA